MNKKAYLSPDTGLQLLSTIWGFLVIVFTTIAAFVIRHFWGPIKKHKKSVFWIILLIVIIIVLWLFVNAPMQFGKDFGHLSYYAE